MPTTMSGRGPMRAISLPAIGAISDHHRRVIGSVRTPDSSAE